MRKSERKTRKSERKTRKSERKTRKSERVTGSRECGVRNAECKDKCKAVAPHTPGKVASGEILFSVISSGPLLFSAPLRLCERNAFRLCFPISAFQIVPRLSGPSAAHIRNVAVKLHTLYKHKSFPRSLGLRVRKSVSRPLAIARSRSACEQTHTGRAKIAKEGFS